MKIMNNEKGMTLVEIIAATTIIGLVFVSLMSLFNESFETSRDTREISQMTMVAQELMEKSIVVNSSDDFDNIIYDSDISDEINSVYGAKYKAKRLVTDKSAKLKKVVIKVWENGANEDSGVTLVTQVSDVY